MISELDDITVDVLYLPLRLHSTLGLFPNTRGRYSLFGGTNDEKHSALGSRLGFPILGTPTSEPDLHSLNFYVQQGTKKDGNNSVWARRQHL